MAYAALIKPQIKDRVEDITLLASAWIADGDNFKQTVTFASNAGARTKANLACSASTYKAIQDDKVTQMYIVNNNGTFTVYAVDNKPSTNITVQCSLSETIDG